VTPICTKSFVGWGFVPNPTGGAYSAPSDTGAPRDLLAVFRGLLLKGGERTGGEERGGREGGSSSFALGSKKKWGLW